MTIQRQLTNEGMDAIRKHKRIYSLEKVSWAVTGIQQVRLSIKGATFTPGWTHFILVPSVTHTSTELHHHFDAWGLPPSDTVVQLTTPVAFEHILPTGNYYITIHSFTDTVSNRIVADGSRHRECAADKS